MRTDLKIHVSGYYSYHLRRDGTAVIDRYTGSEDELALPCQLDGFPVTGIGQEAFSDHREIKKCYPSGRNKEYRKKSLQLL